MTFVVFCNHQLTCKYSARLIFDSKNKFYSTIIDFSAILKRSLGSQTIFAILNMFILKCAKLHCVIIRHGAVGRYAASPSPEIELP